ncbi:potassium channel family protein [Rhodococcus kronopolitis]|uniref:Potassium channel family protein n=1 Tax=Rhodococcus kronopolitis TaxID=1460226 RepID=A0ABV9FNQ9_9NOCA
MQAERFDTLPKAERRKLIRRAVLRPMVTAVGLVVAYFALPMQLESGAAWLGLLLGGSAVAALCVWQIWRIVQVPNPGLQAVEALALTVPAYLLSSAVLFYLMSVVTPGAFNEPLSRIDSLYFTLACFATVGFGDIAAHSETARAVVSAVMVGNLLLLAVGVRVIAAAVRLGRSRRELRG